MYKFYYRKGQGHIFFLSIQMEMRISFLFQFICFRVKAMQYVCTCRIMYGSGQGSIHFCQLMWNSGYCLYFNSYILGKIWINEGEGQIIFC